MLRTPAEQVEEWSQAGDTKSARCTVGKFGMCLGRRVSRLTASVRVLILPHRDQFRIWSKPLTDTKTSRVLLAVGGLLRSSRPACIAGSDRILYPKEGV